MDEDIPKLPKLPVALWLQKSGFATRETPGKFVWGPCLQGKIHKNLAMVEMIDIWNDGAVIHTWKSTLQNPTAFL